MKAREIFDKVKKHLTSQRGQSSDPDGACLYRDPNGLKCAVGAIIPDELYSDKIEGETVKSIITRAILGKSEPLNVFLRKLEPHADLLTALQRVHDRPISWDENGFSRYGKKALDRIEINYFGSDAE